MHLKGIPALYFSSQTQRSQNNLHVISTDGDDTHPSLICSRISSCKSVTGSSRLAQTARPMHYKRKSKKGIPVMQCIRVDISGECLSAIFKQLWTNAWWIYMFSSMFFNLTQRGTNSCTQRNSKAT